MRRQAVTPMLALVIATGCSRSSDPTAPEPTAVTPGSQPLTLLAASNTWTAVRSMPKARRYAVAGTINNVIYVVGGRTANLAVPWVEAYDVATDTWSSRAPLPSARYTANGASVINGRLYVSGGLTGSASRSKALYVYTPTTNSWARKADMPVAGSCGAQGVINKLLYVYVGCINQEYGHRFFRYNPVTNTWIPRKTPPYPHHAGPAAGVINGRFYLTSGNISSEDFPNPALHVYNPKTDLWETRSPASAPVVFPASGILNGQLFVAGGGYVPIGVSSTTVARVTAYDPILDLWSSKAPMPVARAEAAAAVAGGRLFVFGGVVPPDAVTRRSEVYTP